MIWSHHKSLVTLTGVSLCVCDSVCLSVYLSICLHDKTKTAETKITKLVTVIIHHDISPTNEY